MKAFHKSARVQQSIEIITYRFSFADKFMLVVLIS